ncbi:MAG TPA: hypothetical protein PKC29_09985 [Thermodesulfobacteriota bacterium]|nr:hypothetical protein [Thermodesulfobacteriota bacterium]
MDTTKRKERKVWHFCPGCSTWRTADKFQAKKIMRGAYGNCDECLSAKPKMIPEARIIELSATGK